MKTVLTLWSSWTLIELKYLLLAGAHTYAFCWWWSNNMASLPPSVCHTHASHWGGSNLVPCWQRFCKYEIYQASILIHRKEWGDERHNADLVISNFIKPPWNSTWFDNVASMWRKEYFCESGVLSRTQTPPPLSNYHLLASVWQ